jgi:pimeloyl-ACP methyl ester carboxylesterase
MTDVSCTTVTVDVSAVAPAGVDTIAADVFAPSSSSGVVAPAVLFCFPGGGMSRRYYDIPVPPGAGSYSMARHIAGRGFVVVTVDHIGVGESSRPDDGYTLTPPVVADASVYAVTELLERLAAGRLDGAPRVDRPTPVGVGHSMGALLTVWQQARHGRYNAVCLLGFGAGGLARALSDKELQYAGDATRFHADLPKLVEARWGEPLPIGTTATSPMLLAGMPIQDDVLAAMEQTTSTLLAPVGLTSMMPGSSTTELQGIDVPVFLGVGSNDITGEPRCIPAAFTNASDITLFVLADAGHNHNVAPNREQLWDRIVEWIISVT